MSRNQQNRMQSIPVTTYVGVQTAKPEDNPAKVVKMMRVRDMIICGSVWSLTSLVMMLMGDRSVDIVDVVTPISLVLAVVLVFDKHHVKL